MIKPVSIWTLPKQWLSSWVHWETFHDGEQGNEVGHQWRSSFHIWANHLSKRVANHLHLSKRGVTNILTDSVTTTIVIFQNQLWGTYFHPHHTNIINNRCRDLGGRGASAECISPSSVSPAPPRPPLPPPPSWELCNLCNWHPLPAPPAALLCVSQISNMIRGGANS